MISILHKDTRISTKMKKSNYIGSLVWDGYHAGYAKLKDIPKHVKLAKGDTLVTSSYSAIFPEGIMIGVIDEFEAYRHLEALIAQGLQYLNMLITVLSNSVVFA